VLVIAGEFDRAEILERLKSKVLANIESADLKVVEGAGHLMVLE
jgi:hypothetical protein